MLDKKQQMKNAIIYMIPIGLGVLPFITMPIFTRILTPEDYGILALSMIYAIFMSGLANFGISLIFERNYFQYKDNPEKLAQLFFSSLVFVTTNFVVLAGLTYLFKDDISALLTKSDQHGILILTTFAGIFFINTANNFYFIYFKNAEKAIAHSKYRIASSILNFIISLILVAYFRVGIIGIVIAQLITGITLFFYLLYLFLKELRFSLNKSILLESLKISYPLIPGTFVKLLNTNFDKYMIGLLATVGGVGVYHIGKIISELSFTFMTALQNVFNPQVYQRMFGQHKRGSESIGRYLNPFLYLSIFPALCIALFSEEVITVLTPVSYHGAIPIITILSMYIGFQFFGKINGTQLIYTKKTHISSLLAILSFGLNIGLNIPMIMKFGAVGAAWATMLAGLFTGTISLLVAQHYYKIIYEWNKIIWIMATFFTGSSIIATMNLLDLPYLWPFLVKMTAMIVFIYLGIRYGILTRNNYQEVRSAFRLTKPLRV